MKVGMAGEVAVSGYSSRCAASGQWLGPGLSAGIGSGVEQAKLTRAFTDAALGWLGDKDRTAWNEIFAVEANFATGIITFNHGAKGILDIL